MPDTEAALHALSFFCVLKVISWYNIKNLREDKMDRRRIIDISMVILLPMLMAYSLIGETFHEAAGTLMFILFIVHHVMNRGWYST